MEVIVLILGAVNLVSIFIAIFIKLNSSNKFKQLNFEKNLLNQEIHKLNTINDQITQKFDHIIEKYHQLNTDFNIKLEVIKQHEQRAHEWENLKQQSADNAKAAVFEVGQKLSQQLIELTKQENKATQELSHQQFLKNSNAINEQFLSVTQMVATLKNEVKSSNDYLDQLKRALLSPSSAGQLGELTLENILKSSGLLSGVDFLMQYHLKDNNNILRPDAVVFLPNHNIMVIDSKSSKFLIELGDQTNYEQATQNLLLTMNNHLKSLASKDYKESTKKQLSKEKKINHVSIMMFVPSESALEKIQALDKSFMHRAWEIDIFPIGPAGLVNILSHAKFVINETLKNEHTDQILEQVHKVISSLNIVTDHAKKLGQNLKSISQSYDKFAASFNGNLIPKINKIQQMGIDTNKAGNINLIERHQIVSINENSSEENNRLANDIEMEST